LGPSRKSGGGFSERLLVPRSGGGALGVALVHPSTYSIGMSSLGYQAVFRILNDTPGVWVERAFAGSREEKKPRTIESGRHVADFDIIAFSLSYEPDSVKMLRLLRDCGIPIEARKRHGSEPFVIAGGIAATLNPEPYADFVDLLVIGEAEESLPELMKVLIELRGASRTRVITEAAKVPGVYAPRLYEVEYGDGIVIKKREPKFEGIPERVGRRWMKDIDLYPARSVLFAPQSDFGAMGLVEISRGCGRGCRFCAAGHIMRPPRHRSLKSLEDDIKLLSKDFDCLGLVASSATDHPKINELIEMVRKNGMAVSFASLPIDGLSEKILEAAAERSKTLTIAPETGTDRLRRVVNKDITNEEIVDAAKRAAGKGIKRIKLYFLVGLPTESGEDVAAIGDLVRLVAEAARKVKKNIEIVASVAPFVPKANTPFELHPMDEFRVIEARIAEITGIVRKITGAVVRAESPVEAMFQGILSRGDRRAGRLIRKALDEGGSVRRAMHDLPEWAVQTLRARRTLDQPTPWSFIDSGLSPAGLLEEYHVGLLGRLSPRCKPPKCRLCNVCT